VKGGTTEVIVFMIQDLIEEKGVEVASADDVPIRVVRKANALVEKVIHILVPEVGIVLESIGEIE
jgi:hypothetical protein